MRFPLFLLSMILAVGAFVACGDDGDDEEPGGPAGTDEEYLAVICQGTQDISNALVTKTTADEIGDVIEDFIEIMENANPPEDLRACNDEFVQYLEDSLADPTSVTTRQPPLPEEDIQRRLAQKELQVDECKDGTYFSRDLPAEE